MTGASERRRQTSTLPGQLFEMFAAESLAMPYTMNDFGTRVISK